MTSTAAEPVSYLVAFTAGVLSFLSPCVLPLIPGYIAFISGRSLEELTDEATRAAILGSRVLRALAFGAGFTVVFTVLGASASVLGQFVGRTAPVLSKVAGVVLVLLGLHTTGWLKIPWLNYERRLQTRQRTPSLLGAGVVGMAFAFGWTPCIGPILAGILALAAAQTTVLRGVALLLVYSLGLGVPFLLTALGLGAFLKWFARYKRFIRWGELAAGILLIILGILMATNHLTALLQFVPTSFFQFAR